MKLVFYFYIFFIFFLSNFWLIFAYLSFYFIFIFFVSFLIFFSYFSSYFFSFFFPLRNEDSKLDFSFFCFLWLVEKLTFLKKKSIFFLAVKRKVIYFSKIENELGDYLKEEVYIEVLRIFRISQVFSFYKCEKDKTTFSGVENSLFSFFVKI